MKHIYLLFSFFLTVVSFAGSAQVKKDTILSFYKSQGNRAILVDNIDSADYYRVITPPDSLNPKLYLVREYYKDHTLKFIGRANAERMQKGIPTAISLEGSCIEYYPNKKKRSIIHYSRGDKDGICVMYYPNGNMYTVTQYVKDHRNWPLMTDCYDAQGNQLAHNGNGRWIVCVGDMRTVFLEGEVKDGIMDGEWQGITTDQLSLKYVFLLEKGKVRSGKSYDLNGNTYTFDKVLQRSEYKGGVAGLLSLARKRIKPVGQKKKHPAVVNVTFIVGADGRISDISILNDTTAGLKESVAQLLDSSEGWTNFVYYGKPLRSRIFMTLNIGNDDSQMGYEQLPLGILFDDIPGLVDL